MKKYRVIQWATGVVGSAALRGILRHPKLELAGVKVYSEAKEGLDADCVIYFPLPWDTGDICRLLESGKHVIWFVGGTDQARLQSKMDIPRESGWRISLEGDVNLNRICP